MVDCSPSADNLGKEPEDHLITIGLHIVCSSGFYPFPAP